MIDKKKKICKMKSSKKRSREEVAESGDKASEKKQRRPSRQDAESQEKEKDNVDSESSSSKLEKQTFKELGVCEPIVDACASMGWHHATEIQRESLPYALQGRDIIGLAETGSGKTGAFAIPIIQDLLSRPQGMFALVMAPTRELAFQIAEQFEALGSTVALKCAVLVGGVNLMSQAIALAKRPHVIVATPGRLVWHLENTKGFQIGTIKYLVLDEADRLFSMDFEDEVDAVLAAAPRERRTYLFSATMTSKVKKLQRASLRDPVRVTVSTKYQTVATLRQHYVFMPAKHKDCYLAYIMNEFAGNTCIVFVSTCAGSMRVALLLRNLGFSAVPINGKMSQGKRLGALAKFRAGERLILIATDVAARGLDIPHVDLVLNLELPSSPKEYVHRVGRTARAGASGRSISFVTQYDVEVFQGIEAHVSQRMDLYPTEQEVVLVLLERVAEAQRFANMQLKEMDESTKQGQRKFLTNNDGKGNADSERHASSIKRRQRGGRGDGGGRRGRGGGGRGRSRGRSRGRR
jgi:ATP-dependent RNA helicase DDX47/RRP3